MPAPDLKPQVPGAVAEPTQPAADTPLQALIKQTVVLITEALPGLTARDLVELRDLETAGDNRKGVLQAIEAEDKRREDLADEAADAEDNASAVLVPDYVHASDANRLYGESYGVDWVYEGGAYVPQQVDGLPKAAAADVAAAAAGQAVLTDQGWVVPEPPKKG